MILSSKQTWVTLALNRQEQGCCSQPKSAGKSSPPFRQLGIRPEIVDFYSLFGIKGSLTKKGRLWHKVLKAVRRKALTLKTRENLLSNFWYFRHFRHLSREMKP
jgi:hypothetical protein